MSVHASLAAVVVSILTFPAPAGAADEAAAAENGDTVTFFGQVKPLLRRYCEGCHGGRRPRGGLDVGSLEALLEGGSEGPALVPGDPGRSLLFQLVSKAGEPYMPPEEEAQPSAAEIEVLRRWIEAGCLLGDAPTAVPYSQPLAPPTYRRPAAVTALVYSSDGDSLYVGGYKEILVHRIAAHASGSVVAPQARWLGEAEQIYAFCLSPDGRRLAAAGGNPARFGELQLWDTRAGRLARFHRLGADTLFAVDFSASGERIVAAGADRRLYVLDATTGETLLTSEIHADWVFGVAFTAGDTRIASTGRDRSVKLSDAADGAFLRNAANLDDAAMRLAKRPGGDHFVVGGLDRRPVLFDAREGRELRTFERQPGAVLALAFSADGRHLAVAGNYGELRVYRAEDGEEAASFEVGDRWTYVVAFHPDGQRLAAAGFDGRVRIFRLRPERRQVQAFVAVPIAASREF